MVLLRTEVQDILSHHMELWNLSYDGDGFYTHSSFIQPVLWGSTEAILKIPIAEEEKRGSKLLLWWNGNGAVTVLKCDDEALLMERISGSLSLETMAVNGQDDDATRIICATAAKLHSFAKGPLPELVPLDIWFRELFSSADGYGGIFRKSAHVAELLLGGQDKLTVLHGDLHHNNVLYSGQKGWLAIDPKGLIGDRTFDYVNILLNPDRGIALAEGRLMKQIDIISQCTGIEPYHVLKWTVAWAGLSAVWFLNDGMDAGLPVGVLKSAIGFL